RVAVLRFHLRGHTAARDRSRSSVHDQHDVRLLLSVDGDGDEHGEQDGDSFHGAHFCMIGRLAFVSFFVAAAVSAQAPHDDWRTIATAHFRVHYPAAYQAWAARAASRLETVRAAVVAEVGFAPETVTDVLIENPSAEANGVTI